MGKDPPLEPLSLPTSINSRTSIPQRPLRAVGTSPPLPSLALQFWAAVAPIPGAPVSEAPRSSVLLGQAFSLALLAKGSRNTKTATSTSRCVRGGTLSRRRAVMRVHRPRACAHACCPVPSVHFAAEVRSHPELAWSHPRCYGVPSTLPVTIVLHSGLLPRAYVERHFKTLFKWILKEKLTEIEHLKALSVGSQSPWQR